jgi:ankyrin repeat protein
MAQAIAMGESPHGSMTVPSTGDYTDLHELAKGWKAAIIRAKDPATRYVPLQQQDSKSIYHQRLLEEVSSSCMLIQTSLSINRYESQVKNDRGNLPLHSAASFRAPLEVTEALLEAYPEAASLTNNYGNLALHFTAWKKGPLDVEKLLLKVYPEGAAQRNNHGNLPLHYAAHYNAPLEVVEALYHAYPEGALQKNNDNNTPLDLAIADGASPNVVALLQGQSVPPTDDEVLTAAKARCERMEKELQRSMEQVDGMSEDRELVMSMLMDIREQHPHALYSAGIDPTAVNDIDSLLEQVCYVLYWRKRL